MKILIKYATRSRPEAFLNALRNIKTTIGYDNYVVLVSIDNTDGSMDDSVCNQARKIIPNILIYRDDNFSKIQAINADMDKAPEDWDLLINMSDDMIFTQSGWADKMIAHIRSVWKTGTDFFAHFNDGYVHHRLPTMSIMGRDYYERDKYIYYPEYKSFSCDAEAMFVAMMRRRYQYFNTVLFNHIHPANTNLFSHDQLYRNNGRHEAHDTVLYFQRRANFFFVKDATCFPFNPDDRGTGDVLTPPYEHPESAAIEVLWRSRVPDTEGQSGTINRSETKQIDGLGYTDESYPSGIY